MKTLSDRPQSVLVVVAHPDDADFICGGTLASWAKLGTEATLLICTDGAVGGHDESLTPEELTVTREQEQQAAADELGVKAVRHLKFADGALECTRELKAQIVQVIREVKPEAVVTFDPTFFYSSELQYVNHPDHRAAGEATMAAVYPLARDKRSFPEQGLEPHKTKTLLLFNPDRAECCVDITEELETKCRALLSHVSQFDDEKSLRDMVGKFAKHAGQQAGCDCAESFVRLDLPV